MKRFVYKLETLLELKKNDEERIMLQLAEKNRVVIGKKKELEQACDALKSLQTGEKKRRSGNETITELRYSVSYRYKLKSDILALGRAVDDLQAEASIVRKRLVAATQARTALERVKARQLNEWKRERVKKEQEFIDDVAQQRYNGTVT